MYVVEDDLSDWIYNFYLFKFFLKIDEIMLLFDLYGKILRGGGIVIIKDIFFFLGKILKIKCLFYFLIVLINLIYKGINVDIWSRFLVMDVIGFVLLELVDINFEVVFVSDI